MVPIQQARGAEGVPEKATVLQDTLAKVRSEAPDGGGQGIVAACGDGLDTGEGDIHPASLHTGATVRHLLAGQGGLPSGCHTSRTAPVSGN
ncbi:hypothetical protein [Kitasatospora sp. NPDC059327]|uniref:hypothetical protein n=1 Tax=Kitasatospora sp. NPDC059327 TaxID=3346803 RepID=UPI0036C763FF